MFDPAYALSRAINYEDIRALARKRLPRVVFDSIDGGAGAERTLRRNTDVFGEVALRPLQANAPVTTDLSIELLGDKLAAPLLLAPCGSARVVHPGGEVAVARATADAGLAYVVPHLGGTRLETVREEANALLWYQIYQYGGRQVSEPAIKRAWAAGYRTLVVTIDNARTLRERDVKNGMGALLNGAWSDALPHWPQFVTHPAWVWRFIFQSGATEAANALLPDGRPMRSTDLNAASKQPDATFRWADFLWIRDLWKGAIVVKGVLSASDAERALSCGADAIIVSNHGGRSLDGLDPALRVLPEVVAAIRGRAPVILDGGVRRGSDILKALCLGAQAVSIGRPYMLALALGQAGVTRMLDILIADLRISLAALGCANPAALSRELVRVPRDWDGDRADDDEGAGALGAFGSGPRAASG